MIKDTLLLVVALSSILVYFVLAFRDVPLLLILPLLFFSQGVCVFFWIREKLR